VYVNPQLYWGLCTLNPYRVYDVGNFLPLLVFGIFSKLLSESAGLHAIHFEKSPVERAARTKPTFADNGINGFSASTFVFQKNNRFFKSVTVDKIGTRYFAVRMKDFGELSFRNIGSISQ